MLKNKMSVISIINSLELNAGPKAKSDITKIVIDNYNGNELVLDIKTNPYKSGKFPYLIFNLLRKIVFLKKVKKINAIKIFQYPVMRNFKILKNNINYKDCILFVHDIKSLKDQINNEEEFRFINKFEYIVCHNDIMKEEFIKHGVSPEKIHVLEIFDYLCDASNNSDENKFDINNIRIAYTGNLVRTKAPFIYQINENKMNFELYLYGIGYDDSYVNSKIHYKGSFNPNELPSNIKEDIGLIWDGDANSAVDENTGFKNYDKFISPHKLSCYIAAGIPVITWKKFGIANFVEKENIGYLIDNIDDINNINFKDYNEKKQNILKLSEKVKNGYYTKRVIDEILEEMEERK